MFLKQHMPLSKSFIVFLVLLIVSGCQAKALENRVKVATLSEPTINEFLNRFEQAIKSTSNPQLSLFVAKDAILDYSLENATPINLQDEEFSPLKSQYFLELVFSRSYNLSRTIHKIDILDQGQTAIVKQQVDSFYTVLNHIKKRKRVETIVIQLENGYPLIKKWTAIDSNPPAPAMDNMELILRVIIIVLLLNLIFVLILNNRHQTGGKIFIVLFLMTIAGSVQRILAFYHNSFFLNNLDFVLHAIVILQLFYLGYPCFLMFLVQTTFTDKVDLSDQQYQDYIYFPSIYWMFGIILGSFRISMILASWTSEIVYWAINIAFWGYPIPICIFCFYVIWRDWKYDLVETRRNYRVVIVVLILLNLMMFSISNVLSLFIYLPVLNYVEQILAIIFILILTSRVIKFDATFFEIRSVDEVKKKSEHKLIKDQEQVDKTIQKLEVLMNEKHIYCQEGLTIGYLAKCLQIQEYRLRRIINLKLGYRNFNDYLNQFRMKEAAIQLTNVDSGDKPILNIALDMGYRSMTSFNKIFKETYGTTPSEYR